MTTVDDVVAGLESDGPSSSRGCCRPSGSTSCSTPCGPSTTSRPRTAPPATSPARTAGSVLFYVGKLWHGGGANRTDRRRLGVILEYVSAWPRPQENHVRAGPRETVAALPERLQELLGFNICPPFVGDVDGRHPRRYIEEPVHLH